MTAKENESSNKRFWWVRSVLSVMMILAVGFALLGMISLAQHFGWISGGQLSSSSGSTAEDDTFTCPMHPQIRQNGPGRCPICGMELVPAAAAKGDDDPYAISISPSARRILNIETATASFQEATKTIKTVGAVAYDESRTAIIAAYVSGRIEKLFADYTGVKVAKGSHLALLYSPELYGAQIEYLQSQRMLQDLTTKQNFVAETQRQLAENARTKLVELGMTKEQIGELRSSQKAETRLTIYAPFGGTVIEKMVEQGMYVKTGQPIYKIADLSMVWLLLELFPEDAAQVRYGQPVSVEITSIPGKTLMGRVGFVNPTVNANTRTVSVRVELENFPVIKPVKKEEYKVDKDSAIAYQLKPGDYANANIRIHLGNNPLIFDPALAEKWISPMHPQIIRNQSGKCPICGMDLVPTSRYGYANNPVANAKVLMIPRSAVLNTGETAIVYVETEPGRFEIRKVVLGPYLDNNVVVREGLDEGEQVATAGNFLIDSQMQLEGKPSVIDPAKLKTRKPGPLHLQHFVTKPLSGISGETLEKLYDAYLQVQKELAADKTVPKEPALALHDRAKNLLTAAEVPQKFHQQLSTIVNESEHLHHLPIAKARDHFKAISESVLKLAAQLRGDQAKTSFVHFYCPHVKDGRGNWLQESPPLANPYYGSRMLRCGNEVTHLPVKGGPKTPKHDNGKND